MQIYNIYVFKCHNCDADLVILMFNADLHSRVKKRKRLPAGAIQRSFPVNHKGCIRVTQKISQKTHKAGSKSKSDQTPH